LNIDLTVTEEICNSDESEDYKAVLSQKESLCFPLSSRVFLHLVTFAGKCAEVFSVGLRLSASLK